MLASRLFQGVKPVLALIGSAVSFLFAQQAHCSASDELCHDIAKLLLAGKAVAGDEPGYEPSILDRLSRLPNPIVVVDHRHRFGDLDAALKQIKATPALAEAARNIFGNDPESLATFVVRLGGSGVGALKQSGGTALCESSIYFNTAEGGAVPIQSPPDILKGACWNDITYAGQVASVSTVMEEAPAGQGIEDITVQPWQNHAWGTACRIKMTTSQTLFTDGAFCANGVDCKAIELQARRLVERYRASPSMKNTSDIQPSSDFPSSDAELLADSSELSDLPEFGVVTSNPYSQFENAVAFPLQVAAKPAIGVVGNGSFGWRIYPGYLAAIWSTSGGKITPLAGFQFQSRRDRVAKLTIDTLQPR